MTDQTIDRRGFLGLIGGLQFLELPCSTLAPAPETLWKTTIGTYASPISLSEDYVTVSTNDGLVALSTDDGLESWQFRTGGRPAVQEVSENVAVLQGSTEQLIAIDLSTGVELWRNELGINPVLDTDSNRLVVENGVDLVGLSLTDGSVQWRHSLNESGGRPLVSGETFFVGLSNGVLTAISTFDGKKQWTVALPTENSNESPGRFDVVGQSSTRRGFSDIIYIWEHGENTLHSLSSIDGDQLWQLESDREYFTFPGTITDEVVYTLDGTSIRAVSAGSGTKLWEFGTRKRIEIHPSVTDEVVYARSGGTIYALSKDDGSVKWTFDVRDDSIVLLPEKGRILSYCGDPTRIHSLKEDGSLYWVQDFDDVITLLEISRNAKVFVGTDSGAVYAVGSPPTTLLNSVRRSSMEHRWGLATVGLLGGSVFTGVYLHRRAGKEDDTKSTSLGSLDDLLIHERIYSDGVLDIYRASPQSNDENELLLERLTLDALECHDFADTFSIAVEEWESIDQDGAVSLIASRKEPEPWVVFERPGENLTAIRSELTVEESVDIVSATCEIVNAAHKNDAPYYCLSPESIYVTADDRSVSLANWGLAELIDSISPNPSVHGAPEQVGSVGNESSETMVYRLGSIAYWLLTGNAPDDGNETLPEDAPRPTPPSRLNHQLPEGLDGVILTALAHSPRDRFQSPLEFRDALRWATFIE